jgi:hypothetical protein
MGLLDDAIREHLDLKRRRGADPTEVQREEAEALGPVRREVAAEADADGAAPAHEGSYADHEPPALDEPAVVYDDEPEPSPRGYEDPPRPVEPPITHDAPYPEPEDESATPPHGDPLAHQQTREFSATELGEALGDESRTPAPDRGAPTTPPTPPHGDPLAGSGADVVPGDDEDVPEDELQETPDFLQETPEHDRLWFEQKPPKDFDF